MNSYYVPTGDGLLVIEDDDKERFRYHDEHCKVDTYTKATAQIGQRKITWLRCDMCGERFNAKPVD